MKKIIITLILIFTSSTYSQIINSYGIKFGGSAFQLIWENNYNDNYKSSSITPYSKIGFDLGIFAELLNYSNFCLVTEANYIQKIAQQNIHISENDLLVSNPKYWKLSIDYFNFSLLAKPKLTTGLFTPYMLIGPSLDLELNRKIENETFYNDNFRTNRFGLNIGLGVEINLNSYEVLTEFIYQNSFTKLYKEEGLNLNTRSIDFRLGIKL